eukprot:CAMPEP_0119153570 /NCGR_PEP_ID=MMETSP1310-20130426/49438_1 /TAXON_ID=464262 /ORGANISM="Genus nov. species nov., Strain RCC2339" /LENGTH=673 /DNA_ID=CAMNT_0007146033 /DNA_START=64 /DNA_END=2085 /DNA_ORIENTATION=+
MLRIIVLLSIFALARASTVYLSPSGEGTSCTETSPCASFTAAEALLTDNGVLRFLRGEYFVTETFSTGARNITVSGDGASETILNVDTLGEGSTALFELTASDLRYKDPDVGVLLVNSVVNNVQTITFSGLTMTTSSEGCLAQSTAFVSFPKWQGQNAESERGLLKFEDVQLISMEPCTTDLACSATPLASLISMAQNNRNELIDVSLTEVIFRNLPNFLLVSRNDNVPCKIGTANLVVRGLVAEELQTCRDAPILGTWSFDRGSEHSIRNAVVSVLNRGPLIFAPNMGFGSLPSQRSLDIRESVFDSITFKDVLIGFPILSQVYGEYAITVTHVNFTRNAAIVKSYNDEERSAAILNIGGYFYKSRDGEDGVATYKLTGVNFFDNTGIPDDTGGYAFPVYHVDMVSACVVKIQGAPTSSHTAPVHITWTNSSISNNGRTVSLPDSENVAYVSYTVLNQCKAYSLNKFGDYFPQRTRTLIADLLVTNHLATNQQPGVFQFANANVTILRSSFTGIRKNDQYGGYCTTPPAVVKIASSPEFLLEDVLWKDCMMVDGLHVTKSMGAVVSSRFVGGDGLLAGAAYIYEDPADATQVLHPTVAFVDTLFSTNMVAGWCGELDSPYVSRQAHVTCGPGANSPGETVVVLGPHTQFTGNNIKAAAGCANLKCSPPLDCK